jgi:hypothetical protein
LSLALTTTTPPLNCLKGKEVSNREGGGTNSSCALAQSENIKEACRMNTKRQSLRRTLELFFLIRQKQLVILRQAIYQ